MPLRLRHLPRPTQRAGMTLIELLLAFAIAVLVVAVVYSLYHTVVSTLRGQQARRHGAEAAEDALSRLSRDLACAFANPNDDDCRFVLKTDEAGSSVGFCAAVVPDGETDLRWFYLERAAYRLVPDEDAGPVLVRESRGLTGPGALAPTSTNRLVEGVTRFKVTVFDGNDWQNAWTDDSSKQPPRAARVEMAIRQGTGEREFRTEVFIPTGNSIETSLKRLGLPAAP